jgi:hypothetical protein
MLAWKTEMLRVCREMHEMCKQIAAIPCHFNPVFELYALTGGYAPGASRANPAEPRAQRR